MKPTALHTNTLVVVTSDHGVGRGLRGNTGGSQAPYEEMARIPLFIKSERFALPGKTSYAWSSGLDIFPTILDLAGIPPPRGLRGISLVDYLGEKEWDFPRLIFSEEEGGRGVMVRSGPWKYIERYEHPSSSGKPGSEGRKTRELFYLDTDPAETRNLIEIEKSRAALMQEKVACWRKDLYP